MRILRMTCLLLLTPLQLASLCGFAAAAEPGAGATPLTAQSVSRRLKLLESLIEAERTQTRLALSQDPQVQFHYRQAMAARDAAATSLAEGQLETASAAVGRGYGEMMLVLRKAPDEAAIEARERERYEELSSRVLSFSEAYQRVAAEKNDPAVFGLLDQTAVNRLLEAADALAAHDNHKDANTLLERAAVQIETALRRARDRETLVQQLSFETPAAEFDYELRRNESYEMLVRLFEQQRRGAQGALRLLKETLERNEATRSDARALFAAGDERGAIILLERSSGEIARLLQMSGLAF